MLVGALISPVLVELLLGPPDPNFAFKTEVAVVLPLLLFGSIVTWAIVRKVDVQEAEQEAAKRRADRENDNKAHEVT